MNSNDSRIYYSIGEVAEMFDVSPTLIRFWEQKFDILKPHRNKKGNRLFTPEDLDNLKIIYRLVKENGMTLAGAQKRLKDNRLGIKQDLEILDRLYSIKSILLEMRQALKVGTDDFDAEYETQFNENTHLAGEPVLTDNGGESINGQESENRLFSEHLSAKNSCDIPVVNTEPEIQPIERDKIVIEQDETLFPAEKGELCPIGDDAKPTSFPITEERIESLELESSQDQHDAFWPEDLADTLFPAFPDIDPRYLEELQLESGAIEEIIDISEVTPLNGTDTDKPQIIEQTLF